MHFIDFLNEYGTRPTWRRLFQNYAKSLQVYNLHLWWLIIFFFLCSNVWFNLNSLNIIFYNLLKNLAIKIVLLLVEQRGGLMHPLWFITNNVGGNFLIWYTQQRLCGPPICSLISHYWLHIVRGLKWKNCIMSHM